MVFTRKIDCLEQDGLQTSLATSTVILPHQTEASAAAHTLYLCSKSPYELHSRIKDTLHDIHRPDEGILKAPLQHFLDILSCTMLLPTGLSHGYLLACFQAPCGSMPRITWSQAVCFSVSRNP